MKNPQTQPIGQKHPGGRPPRDNESAVGHIHIRTTLDRKSAYVRKAKPQKLSEWITEQCDRAANYEPEKS